MLDPAMKTVRIIHESAVISSQQLLLQKGRKMVPVRNQELDKIFLRENQSFQSIRC